MPLAVRDLARGYGKEVQLILEGENTQVDRILVERLLEPLLHLVRNAITHGIETPDERRAAGKPRVGHICISGQPQGEWIKIVVEDDGRGIDMAAIKEKALKLGLIEADQELNNNEALDLIMMPGFTTQEDVNLGAGRGIGMDVVMRSVRSMHGSLSLQTEPGKCTRFSLRLPLTLTIMNVILVRSDGETYAIPQTAVDELIEIDPQKIVTVESGQLYPYKDASLPLVHLPDLFQFHLQKLQEDKSSTQNPSRMQYALISGKNEHPLALVVDRLVGIREAVVRTLPDPLVAQPCVAGATELGDGSLVLILDLLALFEIFRQRRR
jgi:two-component system chemotaxis sensor kinase CheA